MRVLIVHNRYRSTAPSGESRVVDQESEALTSLGHEVEHFERHSDDIEGWSSLQKATLPARVIWNPSTRRALAGVLRRFTPDVAHVHNTFPLLSPSVLYACRDEGVPVVATLHNYKLLCASGDFFRDGAVCHDCAGGVPVSALVHRCYRGSALATVPAVVAARAHRQAWRDLVAAYVLISASLRRLLGGMDLDPERVFVKPNLVPDDGSIGRLVAGQPRERQVAYLGRLDRAKGVPLLLSAWDRYRAAAGDGALRLVIAGGGPLEGEVARWAAERPSVELAGHLGKQECFDVIARSRAVLLPSQWEETFGLVVVEAMAAGVAPIAAAHGSFPELITDGVDGALFPAGDPDALAKVIQDVDTNRERFDAYGRQARTTYEQRHDPRRNIDQLLDIYRFAMARHLSAGRDRVRRR
jgi:glycosyltransferase involved in cell wall biosynthesis